MDENESKLKFACMGSKENRVPLPAINIVPPEHTSERKRKASDSFLSSSLNPFKRFSPFYKPRKRIKSMGSACTKGLIIDDNREGRRNGHFLSPLKWRQKQSTVQPYPGEMHTEKPQDVNSETQCKRAPLAESNLSMDHVRLQSNNANISNPDRYSVVSLGETNTIPEEVVINSVNEQDQPRLSSIQNGHLKIVENTEQNCKLKPKSLPDLRPKIIRKQNRSKSLGNTSLKSNNASTNLLMQDPVFVKRSSTERQDDKRRNSIEHVINIPRRPSRPTLENTIHFLEADQVNYYQIMEELGRGSFGTVCKCRSNKDNRCYAMKIISKKRLMRKNRMLARAPAKIGQNNPLEPLHREIAILKKMDHPYVVKLIELNVAFHIETSHLYCRTKQMTGVYMNWLKWVQVIDDVQIDNVYMIFELMKHGVVMEVPTENVIPEDRSRRLFRELLLGMEYLHYSKIIHRDIKPSNLLLDEHDHVKIADFGVSNMFEGEDDLLSKYAGSPAFQAPEVLNYDSRDKYSGKAVDIWAMGITLFCFLYGNCPFSSANIGELCHSIKLEPVKFPEHITVDPQVIDLISRMLAKQPKERITIPEIKEHAWVTEGGACRLPATEDHCKPIFVTEEDVKNSIKIISKLTSLVHAKTILKGKSFGTSFRRGSWKRNHSLPGTVDNSLVIS